MVGLGGQKKHTTTKTTSIRDGVQPQAIHATAPKTEAWTPHKSPRGSSVKTGGDGVRTAWTRNADLAPIVKETVQTTHECRTVTRARRRGRKDEKKKGTGA